MGKHTPASFWAKVEIRDQQECWLWQGKSRIRGYGTVSYAGTRTLAHRIAWTLTTGKELPKDGLHLHHTCGNRACCNPAHLELLTRSEHIKVHTGDRCPNNHEPNWGITKRGGRICRECDRERQQANWKAKCVPCVQCGQLRIGPQLRQGRAARVNDTGLCRECYSKSGLQRFNRAKHAAKQIGRV